MTILSCQKRHHEPHPTWDPDKPGYWIQCDGLPQWPYARPKPPRISSDEYEEYQREHGTICTRFGTTLWVSRWYTDTGFWNHPTLNLRKAISYAQAAINEERRETSGS